jgi:hypothetical protein
LDQVHKVNWEDIEVDIAKSPFAVLGWEIEATVILVEA